MWNKNEESFYPNENGEIFIPKEINDKNKKKMEKYIKENLMYNDEDNEEDEEDEGKGED